MSISRFAIRHEHLPSYDVRAVADAVSLFLIHFETGTAKYAVLTLFASIALPVISPLSFMSLALSRRAGNPGAFRSLRSVGTALWSQTTARQSPKFASHDVPIIWPRSLIP